MLTRPELRGTFGMVASTHWLASAAGRAVLEQGGKAELIQSDVPFSTFQSVIANMR